MHNGHKKHMTLWISQEPGDPLTLAWALLGREVGAWGLSSHFVADSAVPAKSKLCPQVLLVPLLGHRATKPTLPVSSTM